MVGTFNGNPLAMAATRAMLSDVATPSTYELLDRLRDRAVAGLEAIIADSGLEAHVVAVGAKGCVVFQAEPVRDYRDFDSLDDRFNHAHWLIQHNGGVFLPPWGKMEQWLISAQHDESDIDRFLGNFDRSWLRRWHGGPSGTAPDGWGPERREGTESAVGGDRLRLAATAAWWLNN